jgi:hypothetical protein
MHEPPRSYFSYDLQKYKFIISIPLQSVGVALMIGIIQRMPWMIHITKEGMDWYKVAQPPSQCMMAS